MKIGDYVFLKFGNTAEKYILINTYFHQRAYVFERVSDRMVKVVYDDHLDEYLVKSPLLEALWGR
jgi:hypothetical protein